MNRQTNVLSNKFIKKAIAIFCVVFTIAGLIICLNNKPLNTNAASSCYFNVQGIREDGSTFAYYGGSNISSYTKSDSWINVTCYGRDSYRISVDANYSDALTVRGTRYGFVKFKKSSGTEEIVNIYQDQPYIRLEKKKYNDYIGASSGSCAYFSLSYNCPFTLTRDNYVGYKYVIENYTGDRVTSGGSYSDYGKYRTIPLKIISQNDHKSGSWTEHVKAKRRDVTYHTWTNYKTDISFIQVSDPKAGAVTYSCNKNGTTYTLKANSLSDGKIKFTISGSNFPLFTAAKCDVYVFDITKKNNGSYNIKSITTSYNEELIDEGWNQTKVGYGTISSDKKTMTLQLYKNGSSSSVNTYTFTLQ